MSEMKGNNGLRPNIILITIDAVRRDRLSCYRYHKNTSPNIDRLAKTSFVFLNAFSSGPNTPHAFMGIMASQNPFSSKELSVRGSPPTLAEMLSENGYWTKGFNAGNPWVSRYYGYDRGFSDLVDFLELQSVNDPGFKFVLSKDKVEFSNSQKDPYSRNTRLRRLLRRCLPQGLRASITSVVGKLADHFSYMDHIKVKWEIDERFTPSVIQWMMRNDREPFFLWIHFMTVHEPYAPPLIDQFLVNHTFLWRSSVNRLRREAGHLLRCNTMTPSFKRQFSNLYDAEIRRVDRYVGKILRSLVQSGVYERSCVVLCSDHGEEFFEHGGLFHSSKLDDEVLRVPLLIHLPGQNSCQFISQRVGLIDLLPTIAEYIGIHFDPNIYEGRSFGKILNGSLCEEEDERILAAEAFYDEDNISIGFNPYDTCGVPRRLCLHNGRFKFVADCTRQNLKIYNVERDPFERNDLSKKHPVLRRVAEAMVREYLRHSERRRLVFVRRKFPHLEPDSFLQSR